MATEKTFYEHLDELRNVIVRCILAIILLSVLAYFFKEEILKLMLKPFDGELTFISPSEPLYIFIKLSFVVGFILSFPYILFETWKYFSDVAHLHNKKVSVYFVLSLLLFYGAIYLCYLFVLPLALDFLIGFESEGLVPNITFSNYFDFVITLLLGFGLSFQFPIILFLLMKFNILTLKQVKSSRSYFIVIIFIISAILTPPDIISQMIMALPLVLLFEITLLIARIKIVNAR